MPQWFCWYSRSGLLAHRRTQCGSWASTLLASTPSTTSRPRISVDQLRPASCDSCTPPPDMAKYRCAGSRGSTITECSFGPSGVPSCTVPIHPRNCASSLTAGSGSQLTPPSSDRNSPCGDVPAYQVSRSLAWPGVSQNVWSTERAGRPPVGAAKAGGKRASFQMRPRLVERKIVGPRWPVLAAASSVRPSRGSSCTWLTVWPRKCGPSAFQALRPPSP